MSLPVPPDFDDEPDYLKELLAKTGVDAQASRLSAKLQEVIIGELHHLNTLAIVSAITSQSLKTANSLDEAAKTIAADYMRWVSLRICSSGNDGRERAAEL